MEHIGDYGDAVDCFQHNRVESEFYEQASHENSHSMQYTEIGAINHQSNALPAYDMLSSTSHLIPSSNLKAKYYINESDELELKHLLASWNLLDYFDFFKRM